MAAVDYANYSDIVDGSGFAHANDTSLFANGGGQEFVDVYSRTTHRVRRALFPEILIEDDDVNGDLNGTDRNHSSKYPNVVEQFAGPSRQLKAAVLDLIGFRDQLDDALNNIPRLIECLTNSKDQDGISKAAQLVHLLSKEDSCVATLASNRQLIGALINAANLTNNDVTKEHALAALSHLSGHPEGRLHIFHSGGIAHLVRMLQSTVTRIVHYAVTTLHNLLLYVEMAKEEIIACGGLEAFTPHLRSHNCKLQALVADSLYFLLLDNPQCKLTFLSLQGPVLLIGILKSATNSGYDKLTYAVVRCIRSLSTCPRNKACIISEDGISMLHQLLDRLHESKWRLAVLNAMRNLSDAATNLGTLSGLVADLIVLVELQQDEEMVSCACGILSNLTCNNNRNKEAVCVNRGIGILAHALNRFQNIEDVTEPALCTLRHCTVRHPLARDAQDELRFAYPIILALMATRRPPIVKAALGLVRNCSLSEQNLQAIIKEKTPEGETVVSIAAEVLEQTGQFLRQDFNGLTEGVSLLEMVEGSISALHQLAREKAVAQFIYNHTAIMSIIVDLMSLEQISNNEDELMMREIMGLIYQLTKSTEGAQAVQMYGPQPYIQDARSSPHISIKAYASIVLKNLTRAEEGGGVAGYTGHYGQSLNNRGVAGGATNTMSSLQRQEMGWMNDGMEPELYNELYNYPPSLNDIKNERIEGGTQGSSWFDTDL